MAGSVRLQGVAAKRNVHGNAIKHYRPIRGQLQDNTVAVAFLDTKHQLKEPSTVQVRRAS